LIEVAEAESESALGPSPGLGDAVSEAVLERSAAEIVGLADTKFNALLGGSAADLAGMADTTFKTALGPSFSPVMTQALLGDFADIARNGALGSLSTLGVIDADRIVGLLHLPQAPRPLPGGHHGGIRPSEVAQRGVHYGHRLARTSEHRGSCHAGSPPSERSRNAVAGFIGSLSV
jgi:hypothetical protein